VSQHVVVKRSENRKYVFGWDQPLQSFFLQVHDLSRDPDDQIIAWLGADSETQMYEVEHLVQVGMEYGLVIGAPMRIELYEERDDGR
jgi:hypothetical protein